MALKTFKPYTKSTRGTILVDRAGLWKGKPFKALVEPKNSMRGRNNNGHITSRNMSGGGHKKMYRLVDFYRKKIDMSGTVERIEYDPNRSCYIMLVKFDDGQHFYYLAPQKIKVGDKVENGTEKEIKVGNCMPLRDIPVGINIHNVELKPGAGGKIARSAGTSVTISGLDGNYSLGLDDVVGAIPVHMFAGIFGTLIVPLTNADTSFGSQFTGVIAVCSFSFILSFIIFKTLKATVGLRISKEAEKLGTDVAEIGVRAYAIRD